MNAKSLRRRAGAAAALLALGLGAPALGQDMARGPADFAAALAPLPPASESGALLPAFLLDESGFRAEDPRILALPAAAWAATAAPAPAALPGPPARPSVFSKAGILFRLRRLASRASLGQNPQEKLEEFWSGQAAHDSASSHARRWAEIVSAAGQTPAGRLALARARRAVRHSGPVRFAFAPLGKNLADYDYADHALRLDRRYLRGDPRDAAASLAHELTHLWQHSLGIPAEALEMELEAHAVSLEVSLQSGLKDSQLDSFSQKALALLRQGAGQYSRWVAEQMPNKLVLSERDWDGLALDLEEDAEAWGRRVSRLRERAAENPGAALTRGLARARRLEARALRDLDFVNSPAGRRRCAAFSRRVRARLERLCAELKA